MNAMQGGDYGDGFLSGAVGSIFCSAAGVGTHNQNQNIKNVSMVAAGSLSAGVTSAMVGDDFWSGFRNGFISSLLNHVMHDAFDEIGEPEGKGKADGGKMKPDGYKYACHKMVNEVMGSTLGYKDYTVRAGISALGLIKSIGSEGARGSFFGALIVGAVSIFRSNYYNDMYVHYAENGGNQGVYYKDRTVISGDYISAFRDIIYVNKKGVWTIQPY